ncbi:condensation domain-containing protein, partial [Andreprevotia lacus]
MPNEIKLSHSDWHPLSAIQKSLWFLYEMNPELRGYFNIAFTARARPGIDSARLQVALDQLIARHEMLRTSFALQDGVPMQAASASARFPFSVVEVDDLDDPAVIARVMDDRGTAFDLHAGPLARACLYRSRHHDECALLLAFDHLVTDGWSLWQILEELNQSLLSLQDGPAVAEALPPRFFDFVAEQQQWLQGSAGERQLEYWRGEVGVPCEPLALQADHRTGEQGGDEGRETVNLYVSEPLTDAIRALSDRLGVTMFATLLASYFLLLSRLSGQRELAVGSPMPGRSKLWNHTIGNFTNPVVLRADIDPALSVADFIKQVSSTAWRGLKNQHYPLSELVERLNPQRGESGQPYFQTLFTFQKARAASDMMGLMAHRAEIGDVDWGGVKLRTYASIQNNGGVGMDLVFDLAETNGRIAAPLDYDTSKFERSTVERFLTYWQELLQGMVDDEMQPLGQLNMLPLAEHEQVLAGWNQTYQDLPLSSCVQELFEARVAAAPDAIALVQPDLTLSYGELNARANQLARHLRGLGVGPDVRVALCVERGLPMLLGLLAVLKAGGAYVPLDPAYPSERIAYMLQDSSASVVL